ncbi:ferric-dicitrate binding protein FerR (iron transport regulator) [Dyadobacter sp. BE34]|uniref:Ferric-dicitrate binding protein FerR (Iron transport regulator) n=1 Tax=Dyadobacter fermentans TaxID=94254 RepID=A0ABU1R4T5_9BACT|nr:MULTISPECIES: FecR domain-containing protein [Dyadobacter]MDR6808424.1 ferric-dicitrate binding protein FerR (iron transport regulator) [Dyadobacter fermentans]MDR7045759.1 ferric-dicitrate binding protein FerR (iron transport regulator) [Dyadobacter sp. BE242]MDR7200072.1 ferric-dicitrate binding protein FerR (iron transport regulator) [Dyadobacter sp. BE34]MDR7218032.1 ferric-dicitrate binding protein FerR (iron transport regulator) [Dyadobacter sp. BE31]MDR7265963.1 ferric-dicitrate bind
MNITPELLARYTAGQCTPTEIQAVEQWLDDPEVAADAITEIPGETRRESGARVWERLRARTARPFWLHYRYYLSGIAALLVLISGIIWYTTTNRADETARHTARMEAAVQTVRTQKGQTRQVTLPDGSGVMLSYDSELRYPSAFLDSVRRVVLIGEAQFSVKKNPKQPFVVETAAAQTRVLGTVFDVREYPGEGSTALLVTEGKVRFSHKLSPKSEIVTAGMTGLIEGKRLTVRTVSGAEAEVSWLHNALRFDDVPLMQVTRELERRYNVSIQFGNEALKNQRYTGAFKNPSLNAVLGSLSIAVSFRYEVKGESISLYE